MDGRRAGQSVAVALALLLGVGCAGGNGTADDADEPQTTTEASVPSASADDAGRDLAEVAAETEIVEPTTPLGDGARAAAARLRAGVADGLAASGWSTTADLVAAGFAPMPGDPVHWSSPAALADGRQVDPARPEFVMVDGDWVVGVMFVAAPVAGGSPPADPPGAPLTRWHRHRWDHLVCLAQGEMVVAGAADADGRCPAGQVARSESPYMFHVWLVGDDPFTEEMDVVGAEHGHG